jgi:hypothetical protein
VYIIIGHGYYIQQGLAIHGCVKSLAVCSIQYIHITEDGEVGRGGGARSHDGASSVLPSTTPAFSLHPSMKGWRGTSFHLSVAMWPRFQLHNSEGVNWRKRDWPENFAVGIRVNLSDKDPATTGRTYSMNVLVFPRLWVQSSTLSYAETDAENWFNNI